jgi:hypothetical protein
MTMNKEWQTKPKRYFQRYGLRDVITDTIRGTDGREHAVSMRGWHWNNLDWIKRNTRITEEMLVDNAVIGLVEEKQVPLEGRDYQGSLTLSQAMEATIYYFIEAYHSGQKGKPSSTEKNVGGTKQ